MRRIALILALLCICTVAGCGNPEITEGYTKDGRVDMMTKEGDEIFKEDCRKAGIPFDSSPLPDNYEGRLDE